MEGFSYLATRRSNELIFSLRQDGGLVVIDPKTGNAHNALNLRTLNVSTDNVLDIAQHGFSNFGGMIIPASSTYGDIAILEKDASMDIFVIGLSQAQVFPFVMRIRVDKDGIISSADVIAASSTSTAVGDYANTTRCIAVNNQGIVATTLPYQNQGGAIFDRFITFSADFPETGKQLPEIRLKGVDMHSMGMDVDPEGNFYIATGPLGTSLAGYGRSGALVKISPTGDSVHEIYSPNSELADSRDVTISTRNNKAYMTILNYNQVVYMPLY